VNPRCCRSCVLKHYALHLSTLMSASLSDRRCPREPDPVVVGHHQDMGRRVFLARLTVLGARPVCMYSRTILTVSSADGLLRLLVDAPM